VNNNEDSEDHDEIYEAYNDNHPQVDVGGLGGASSSSEHEHILRRRLSYEDEDGLQGDIVPDEQLRVLREMMT